MHKIKKTKELRKVNFQQLIDADKDEFKFALKLNQQVIDVTGQERQRVCHAARLLSNTVAKAMWFQFGDDFKEQSKAIITINDWFDCMNSRVKISNAAARCGLGIYEQQQFKALDDMENLVTNMQFCDRKRKKIGNYKTANYLLLN